MQEGRDSRGLGFLYKKVSLHPILLGYWLDVPEFQSEIRSIMIQYGDINDEVVLHVMEKIYADRDSKRKKGILQEDFSFYRARRGITQLRKILGLM